MAFLDLFSTNIFYKDLELISNNEVNDFKSFILSLPHRNSNIDQGTLSINQNILELLPLKKLKENIEFYTNLYFENLGFFNQKFKICNSWSNILKRGEMIQPHIHSNSFISGVYYVEDSTSGLNFISPIQSLWLFDLGNSSISSENPNSWRGYTILPTKNTLLLFPSWLKHQVLESDEEQRISLAFNVIPCGEFGNDTAKVYI